MTIADIERQIPETVVGAVRGTVIFSALVGIAVISLLESGPVVESVFFGDAGAARAMRAGTLVVDMASIKPREARDHAARLGALGVSHLDAPVSGGTVGAEQGTLVIMVGGKAADFERSAPVFRAFGRATHVGPRNNPNKAAS